MYTVFGRLPLLYVLGVIKSVAGDDLFLVVVEKVFSGYYLWWGVILVFLVKLPIYPIHL